jgi:hypothetical protein
MRGQSEAWPTTLRLGLVSYNLPFAVSFRQYPPNVKALSHFSQYYQGDPQPPVRPEEVLATLGPA